MACRFAREFFTFALILASPVSCQNEDAAFADWTSPFKLEDDHQEVTVLEGVTRPLVCEIEGYQSDDLTFVWLNNSKEISQESSITTKDGELTVSTLHFQGSRRDDNAEITCRIFVKDTINSVSNRSVKISVHHKPVVEIRYSQDSSREVYEEDDVTFVCLMKSNPPPTTLLWYHDGMVINKTNNPREVEYLTLVKLNRFSSGIYSCLGVNAVGNDTSNNISVNVRFSPACITEEKSVYFLHEGQQLNISCDVVAYPSPQSFSWKSSINGSLSHRSGTIAYVVHSMHLSNTLYCWAKNEVGEQEVKCTIEIVQATSPEPVTECQMNNSSISGVVDLLCQAGGNGGLQMNFTLIIQDSGSEEIILQETSASLPSFTLAGLEANKQYNVTVISSNSLGAQPYTFIYDHKEQITSFWKPQTILTFLLLLGVIFIIILGITIYCKCSRNQGSRKLPDPLNVDETENFLENGLQPALEARRPHNGIAPRASMESLTTV